MGVSLAELVCTRDLPQLLLDTKDISFSWPSWILVWPVPEEGPGP